MVYLLLGVIGLIVIHISDPAAMKKVPAVKPVAWLAGTALVAFALTMAGLSPNQLSLPSWVHSLGWSLLAMSALLLGHSLFFSLPFRKTYVTAGASDQLVTSGVYALTRHPWLIWFFVLNASLLLATGSRLMLLAGPVFLAVSALSVAVQDKFYFPRIFPGYDAYRRQTPMLLPNRNSLRAFVGSLKAAKMPERDDRHGWRGNGSAG